ncbi:hypothetical protein HCN44_008272 [Aphidius gifuensis]|uniref:Uncharacterized protein n=1 Tax=Aphidius gifuensis TaxID=684658 RepID=A0A835CPX7_APHGI|nr:uncharacterized protein LOC122857973 [Aphidius gifuensis]KAF7989598.1 hypothetical protein HCN44_008272 [Aphidius gifuensis]
MDRPTTKYTQDDRRKPSKFPSKFTCIVCNKETVSLVKLHEHQMYCHSRQELSMTLLSLHSYIYHKQYFETENHLNQNDLCRFYPFCSTLLTEKDENELGEWRALMLKVNDPKRVESKPQTIKMATMTSENHAQQSYKQTNELKTNHHSHGTPLSSTNTIMSSQFKQSNPSPIIPHDLTLAKTLADSNKINLKRLSPRESRARKLTTLRSTPLRKPRIGSAGKSSSTTTSLGLNLSLTKPSTDNDDTKQLSPSVSFLSKDNLALHDKETVDKSKWIPIPSADADKRNNQ